MKRSKKTASILLAFVMVFSIVSNNARITSDAAPAVQGGTTIYLEDWKIAPSGHLTVGSDEYPLTVGLPAEVTDAAIAYNPGNPLSGWVDAKCPGTVVGALLDAGKYEDLFMAQSGNKDVYFDANMTKIPYTDFARPWWWRTSLNIPQSESGKRVTLTFKGINYVGRIWVNGHEISNVNNNISDIRELQNRTGNYPDYTYTTPTTGQIGDSSRPSSWSSVANYLNATMSDTNSPFNFENLKGRFIGAFRTYELDITDYINAFNAPGGSANNVILVEITRGYYKIYSDADNATTGDLLPFWVDWHPTPADNNMGLIGKAFVSTTGNVHLTDPAVASKVAEDLSYADVTFYVNASNMSSAPVTGTLTAVIKDPAGNQVGNPLTVNNVSVPSGKYKQEITAATRINNPQLWWPYMSGDQPLYNVEYTFSIGTAASDTLKHRFGIREITNEVNLSERLGTGSGSNQMQVYVNHKPVLIRGAGYCPTDMYLRQREKDHQGVIDYIKYMGMNAVRDEGKFWSDDLLDLFDENGIMFMSGWCCCDRGQNPNNWLMSERYVAYEALYGQIYSHRAHPCTVMWLNGSDAPPEGSSGSGNAFNVGRKYLEIEGRLNWFDIGVVACSADSTSSVITGANSGLKMSVGYDSCTPTEYYANTRGSYAFVSEGHGGAGIPVIETMKAMIPASNLWPNNVGENYNRWNYHSTRENFPNIDTIAMYIDNTYGGSESLEEWIMRAQVYEYDIQRAQYEAFNLHRYVDATGHINWMTNGTRPGLMWNQFDYYMNPHGSTFGAAKANEPLHIFYDYWQKDICMINNTPFNAGQYTASCTVYDIEGNVIGVLEDKTMNLAADGITGKVNNPTNRTIGYRAADKTTFDTAYTAVTTEYGKRITGTTGINKVWTMAEFNDCLTRPTTDVYFLKLELKDSTGKVVSRNDYAIPRRGDVTGAGGSWARTTAHANADMTQLNQLPAIDLKLTPVSQSRGDLITQTFNVTNDSDAVAYAVELKSYKDAARTELVNPIIYEDNLFTLYPGETRAITITYHSKYFNDYANVIATCYNNVIKAKDAKGNLYAAAYTAQVAAADASTNIARARTAILGASGNGNNATTISANAVTRSNGTYAYTVVESDYSSTVTINSANPYITLDLGSVQSFDTIMVRWNSQTSTGGAPNTLGGRPDHVKVEISGDNSVYETIIADYDNAKGASVMSNIVLDKPYEARYIRITPTGNRTAAAAIDMLTNAYPDGTTANSRRPWMSGINAVSAASGFTINSLEVYRSYSHLIQVDFKGPGNATATANTRDGYGKPPQAISGDVTDKYSRMRMIPNGERVEFRIAPGKPGENVYATLDGVNITDKLTVNTDGTYSFFSDSTDDFAVLTVYNYLSVDVNDGNIKLDYFLTGAMLPNVNSNVILAIYDVEGRLIATRTAAGTIGDTEISNALTVPLTSVPGAYRAKAYIWNANTFAPLCAAAEWIIT